MTDNKIRDRVRRFRDEVFLEEVSITVVTAYLITVSAVVFIAPIHELLHYIGAVMEGGQVSEVVLFSYESWFKAYIHPIVVESAEIGHVTADFASAPRFGGFVFYFLPYIVMFPVSILLMLGDYGERVVGFNVPDIYRLIGGPMFINTFGAFWTDYSLYIGAESAVVPFPAIVWQLLYLGVIVAGVVGSAVYYQVYGFDGPD